MECTPLCVSIATRMRPKFFRTADMECATVSLTIHVFVRVTLGFISRVEDLYQHMSYLSQPSMKGLGGAWRPHHLMS